MKKNRLLVFILLVLICTVARAQETEAADSVVVMGRVVNRLSGEVEPYCRVSFLQGMDTMATVVSDAAGEFGTAPMPAGSYGLSVSLRGMTLYRADLVLNSNAELYISVITDSFQLRTLREVEITAPGHVLAEQGLLIEDPDDPRLWDFTYCDWCPWSGPPRIASASTSGDPNNPGGRVKWGRFYLPAKNGKYISIWQILWPDRKIPAPLKQEKAGADAEEKKE
jgi:hypothetical protein